jgi:beta-galactosidase
LEQAALARLLGAVADDAGIATLDLPEGLRLRRHQGHVFAFNYAAAARRVPAAGRRDFVLGGEELPPAGVAAWRELK